MYFHRRRAFVAGSFISVYGYLSYRSIYSNNEILRMGVAGSLSNLIVESAFHFVDTVNVRAKLSDSNESSMKMVKKIYTKEGI